MLVQLHVKTQPASFLLSFRCPRQPLLPEDHFLKQNNALFLFFPHVTTFLVGLIFLAFGPSYSYSLVRLLYGQKWSDGEASAALRYYCLYIIVLAMNG